MLNIIVLLQMIIMTLFCFRSFTVSEYVSVS